MKQPSRGYVVLAAFLVFGALGPTLSTPEFSRTLENLNVATAIEARRDGHWFVPTLEGQPRTKKPPLAAWITGLAMRPQTVAECQSRDPAARAAAYHRLAWEARWPALVQCCLAIGAVYLLGSFLGAGVEAALLLGSTYLFLRYAQVTLTDVPLTLWVITANAMFALGVFGKQRWLGAVGAGVALGLAFLSKGPVAFVQSLGPWIVWWVWEGRRQNHGLVAHATRRRLGPITAAAFACLVIAVPWYLAVLLRDPQGQWHTWFREVTGTDAPDRRTPFFYYLTFLPEFMPALLFAIPAIWSAFRKVDKPAGERSKVRLIVCMIVVPLVVQSLFKNKSDRYILPLVGPMAVLGGVGLRSLMSRRPADGRTGMGGIVYWLILAGLVIGLAVCGAAGWPAALRGAAGRPWFAWKLGGSGAVVGVVLLVVALRAHQWNAKRVAFFTMAFMLVFIHLLTLGYYGQSPSGRSKMRGLADLIWAQYPDAEIYTTQTPGKRASEDLSIYMSRLTGWMTPPEMVAATPRDKPIVVLMKEKEVPTDLPATWKEMVTLPKEEGETWRVVALPNRAK